MVELNVQTLDTSNFSKDLYISVRIGEAQKLSKASASRNFKFSKSSIGDRRYGKIELFKRVGGSTVIIDPGMLDGLQDVRVPFEEGKSDMQFRISVSGEPQARPAEVEKEKNTPKNISSKVQQAKDYLDKHSLELRLSEAMQTVLRERPDDPGAFIAQRLLANANMVTKIPKPEVSAPAPTRAAGDLLKMPSVGTWYMPLKKAVEQPISDIAGLRMKASELLIAASRDGSLQTTLKEMTSGSKPAVVSSGQAPDGMYVSELRNQTSQTLLKALADGSLDKALKNVKGVGPSDRDVSKLREDTSNLLLKTSADGTLEKAIRRVKGDNDMKAQITKTKYIMPSTTMYGRVAYSTGVRPGMMII